MGVVFKQSSISKDFKSNQADNRFAGMGSVLKLGAAPQPSVQKPSAFASMGSVFTQSKTSKEFKNNQTDNRFAALKTNPKTEGFTPEKKVQGFELFG